MKHVLSALLLILCIVFPGLGQGLYWESTSHVKMMGQDKEMNTQFYAMPKMFKSVEGKEHEAIVRIDKGIIIDVNNTDSTYSEMTFAELEATVKKGNEKMDKGMADLKDKLKDMPEEQRKMVEQMMAKNPIMGGENGKYIVKKTDETEKISGFNCSKCLVMQGDKEVLSVWSTKDVNAGEILKKDLQEFRDRMSALMPRIGTAMAEGMKNMEGFPIRVESSYYNSTVTKVEQQTTPPNAFEPPKGYRKTKSALMKENVKE